VVHVDGEEGLPPVGECCEVDFGSERGLGTFTGRIRGNVRRMISIVPESSVTFTQRRSAVRAPVRLAAELHIGTGWVSAPMVDLSLTGARMRFLHGVDEAVCGLDELGRAGRGEIRVTLPDGPLTVPVIIIGLFPLPPDRSARASAGTDVRLQWQDGLSARDESRLARFINDALRKAA
jgi:hypothetical protein